MLKNNPQMLNTLVKMSKKTNQPPVSDKKSNRPLVSDKKSNQPPVSEKKSTSRKKRKRSAGGGRKIGSSMVKKTKIRTSNFMKPTNSSINKIKKKKKIKRGRTKSSNCIDIRSSSIISNNRFQTMKSHVSKSKSRGFSSRALDLSLIHI